MKATTQQSDLRRAAAHADVPQQQIDPIVPLSNVLSCRS